ncbi:MAG: helicase [Verrucomicrobiae bacterium]|nr:helicase [Verrucomicrobiae bacterium]
MKDIVYFDLETQRSADEVGGWSPQSKMKMKMSIGVTYSTLTGQYHIYTENEVEDLIRQLMRASLVVGFNQINFDYNVLLGYTALDLHQIPSLDMLVEVEKILGHRLKLDAIAGPTLGYGKTADGMEALKWWKQGRIYEIAEYCAYDVKVTKEVFEYALCYGELHYLDRTGNKKSLKVNWKV